MASSGMSPGALSQRRQHQRNDVDPVIEIRAELSFRDKLFKVPVGRADKAEVDLQRLLAADALELALLQDAQELGLKCGRYLADLVEKNRAAMGQLEAALPRRDGACESALLMAEQLGLDHAFGQGGAIDLDEGLALARRKFVDRPGEKFLAGACFTADQHGSIRLGNLLDPVGNGADRPALADDACQLRACAISAI